MVINRIARLMAAAVVAVVPFASIEAARAQSQINLTPNVTLSGKGCPSGSVAGVLNGNTLSLTFNEFYTSAVRKKVNFSNCTLNVGLNIPSGFTVQPLSISYVGFADVPIGGSASMNISAGLGGNVSIIDTNQFPAGFSSDFTRNIPLSLGAFNACAAPKNEVLTVGTNLIAKGINIPLGSETQVGIFSQRINLGEPEIRIIFGFTPC
jgi:hypothetical protein